MAFTRRPPPFRRMSTGPVTVLVRPCSVSDPVQGSLALESIRIEALHVDPGQGGHFEPGPVVHLEVVRAEMLVAQADAGVEGSQIHRKGSLECPGTARASRDRPFEGHRLRLEAAADRHRADHAHVALRDLPGILRREAHPRERQSGDCVFHKNAFREPDCRLAAEHSARRFPSALTRYARATIPPADDFRTGPCDDGTGGSRITASKKAGPPGSFGTRPRAFAKLRATHKKGCDDCEPSWVARILGTRHGISERTRRHAPRRPEELSGVGGLVRCGPASAGRQGRG